MTRYKKPGGWLFGALLLLVTAAVGCSAQSQTGGTAVSPETRVENVRRLLEALAADSMQGRATATIGEERAARLAAASLEEFGVQPAGDSGYIQRVPLRVVIRPNGRRALDPLPSWEAFEALPAEERTIGHNVVGIIFGDDPTLRGEAVIVGAHLDHLGIGPPVAGDSVYNGADDDASGVVAVLEVARAVAAGPPPARSVVFFLATGEELGMLGTEWYLQYPVAPLQRTVAGLFFEMIGRPDSLAGGPGKGWLTGYERSTMGAMLATEGIPLVPDPRPEQNFFERSDNTPFAIAGIPAHVISSYNLHPQYHTPTDEVEYVDFDHMTEVIRAAVRATRLLLEGEPPRWNPGGRP